jgi:hypothetical protein
MSSTEPYPEAPTTGDESGIGPQQSNRGPDWPKKIRTLTATALDRLTTDRTPVEAEPSVYGNEDHKTPDPIEGADLDRPVEGQSQAIAHRDEHLHELDDVRATRTLHHSAMSGEFSDVVAAPVVNIPDRMRISMTRWQSFGAIIVVLCALLVSLGVAALGLATAHEWGCRTGVIQIQCPMTPGGRPSPRTDIPA